MIKRKQAETNMAKRHISKKAPTEQNARVKNTKVKNTKVKNAKVQNVKVQNVKVKNTRVKNTKGQNAKGQNAKGQNALRENAIGRNALGQTGGRKLYVLGAGGLILLLLFSFFVPQLIFRLRDSYLCRDIVHEEQEDMDVALLRAAYEPSLGQRLISFVEAQERGRNFYVSVQEMEVTQELYQQLSGTDGILYQQNIIAVMLDIGMDSYIFLEDNTFTVNCWKQYVIYSDEYTEGVNFIIWYFDLEADDGKRLELLIDAEDGALYALYAERQILLTMNQALKWDINDLMSGVPRDELWYFLHYYYQSIPREFWNVESSYRSKDGQLHFNMDSGDDGTVTVEMLESAWANGEAISSPDAKTKIMHLLFSNQYLDFSFRLFRNSGQNSESSLYPEFYMGIDSISELIPEFAERF